MSAGTNAPTLTTEATAQSTAAAAAATAGQTLSSSAQYKCRRYVHLRSADPSLVLHAHSHMLFKLSPPIHSFHSPLYTHTCIYTLYMLHYHNVLVPHLLLHLLLLLFLQLLQTSTFQSVPSFCTLQFRMA